MWNSSFGRTARLGAAALAVGLLLSASAATAQDKTLVVGAAVFPDNLSTSTSSFAALSLAYQTMDPLVLRDNNGKLLPGLATAWEAVDPQTWRFTLREGVKFHDGEAFDAEDVKFTLDYILDPDTVYGSKSRISAIDGVTIIDSNTVEITTKAPFPTLVRALSDIPIEPQHYHAAVGAEGQAAHPIGTGPFVFGEWTPGDRYELTANPDYWDGAPQVDRLVIRQIPEGSTRLASLLAGETHIIEEVPVDLIPRIESDDNVAVAAVESTVGLILTMDTRQAPFDDPKVRMAMDYAINKPLILEQMLNNTGTLLKGQTLTSNTFGHNPNLEARPYDPEKAKQLLAEAGYPDGFKTALTTRSGKYLSDVDISNAVAGMLSGVGIDLQVDVVEGGVYSKMVKAREMGPIHMVGWFSLGDADFSTVWFTEDSGRAYWKSDEYEELFAKARATVDQTEREGYYHRMMEILHEENPSVYMFGLPSIYAQSAQLSGWGPASDKILRLSKAALN